MEGCASRVEPSPSGGYFVRLAGVDAPVSRHDTEEEARGGRRVLRPRRARQPRRRPAAAARRRRGPDPGRARGGQAAVRARLGAFRRGSRATAASWASRASSAASELSFFTEIDHIDHEAIGALDPESGEGLGVARYVRDLDRPHAAEAAVSVIDAMQGRGLGGLLLRRLCHRAAQNGIRVFTAGLLASNHSMLHLFEKLGSVHVTDRDGPELSHRRRAAGLRRAHARARAAQRGDRPHRPYY